MPDMNISAHQALDELHAVLRQSAGDHGPSRYLPVRYQTCRSALMTGELRPYLPGFIRQCVSLMQFREFIRLYHPDSTVRQRFIDLSLQNCWTQLNERPAHDLDTDDF
jgi:hypothetical protein